MIVSFSDTAITLMLIFKYVLIGTAVIMQNVNLIGLCKMQPSKKWVF